LAPCLSLRRQAEESFSFDIYPEVSLAEARQRREAERSLLRDGKDPMVEKRTEKLARAIAAGNTFAAVADELLAKMAREGRAETTLKKTKWLFDFARPLIGNRPIGEISAAEVLAVLRKVEVRGRLETARRLRSTIGTVFRYAIATARADNDPTFALRGALTTPKVRPRAAVTDPKAVGALLRAVWGYEGQPVTKAALPAMPSYGHQLNDGQIAAVLTYIRNQWGPEAGRVEPGDIAKARDKLRNRND
jgi:integrase